MNGTEYLRLVVREFRYADFVRRLILFYVVMNGCTWTHQTFSEPTISPTRDWKIVQKCGYESCAARVGFLVGKDLTIRIEAHNDIPHAIRNGIFLMQIQFLPTTHEAIEYDPSKTIVQFPNREVLRAKGLPCPRTIMDRSYLLSAPPIIGFQRIDKIDCFRLFFDAPPPRVNEVFIMRIEGVRREGVQIDVPEIVFRESQE